uniref:C-type lectin domain-containing protein n=1 Tax=Terrapene triunguis TaxID=2587831 RepID=A0A674JNC1_9SAUR
RCSSPSAPPQVSTPECTHLQLPLTSTEMEGVQPLRCMRATLHCPQRMDKMLLRDFLSVIIDSFFLAVSPFTGQGASKRYCTGMGSHLVVINLRDEQAFLSSWKVPKGTYTGTQAESYYIGLTHQEEKGQWRWVDQTPITRLQFWKDREPNNLDKEKCVAMDVRGNTLRGLRIGIISHYTATYQHCKTAATNI